MSIINDKRNYLTALFLTALLNAPVAMSGEGRHHQPDFNRLADKLELTDEQRPEFIHIMESQLEKRQSLMSEFREERKQKMNQHVEETRDALGDVLTAEQLESFDTLIEKRRNKMMNKHKRFHHEG